jgi:hypothetical protein
MIKLIMLLGAAALVVGVGFLITPAIGVAFLVLFLMGVFE